MALPGLVCEVGLRGIQFVDCGTSGGVWGLTEGYCLMVGGAAATFTTYRPLLECMGRNIFYVGGAGVPGPPASEPFPRGPAPFLTASSCSKVAECPARHLRIASRSLLRCI